MLYPTMYRRQIAARLIPALFLCLLLLPAYAGTAAAPVANPDSYAVLANQTLTISAPGVLANDTDTTGDPLIALLVTGPSNGSLTLNQNGSFTYNPNAGFIGTDSFTYQAQDADNASSVSNVATVTIITLTFSTLGSFTNATGLCPTPGLTLGPDGSFYGVDVAGGANGDGAVFKMTPGGLQTTIHSFNGADGSTPEYQLVLGRDGNLYGATSRGGPSGYGTIFKIARDATLTTLYPYGSSNMIVGADGNLYGTTYEGGVNAAGSIFKIGLDGSGYSTLYSFTGTGPDGGNPISGLTLASDGNYYGTTSQLNYGLPGTVFRFTPTGTLKTLHAFNGTDGYLIIGGLVQGSDGNLYGTSPLGGNGYAAAGDGSLFKISTDGVFATLHTFEGSDGSAPTGPLMPGTDGNLYGLTSVGGASGEGTVFQVSPAGLLTTLYSFSGPDGAFPQAALIQGQDGSLYGTSTYGGNGFGRPITGNGAAFKLNLGLPDPVPAFASITVTPGPTLTLGPTLPQTQQFTATANDQFGNPLSPQPTISWSLAPGSVGSLSTAGLYHSGKVPGDATIDAKSGPISDEVAMQVAPQVTVATAAAANPNPVTGTTTTLSVLGAYAGVGGAGAITYTWSSTGPAPVEIRPNYTNAASNTTATFTQAGSYTLTAHITSPTGTSAVSAVTVTVDQTLTSIAVSPGPTLALGPQQTQQFTATGVDQFGNVLSAPPTVTWSLASGGVGSITDTGGLYHSGTVAGTATVKANSGRLSGACTVTVN